MALFTLKPTTTRDTDTLARLGKKQVLKRRFGFWSLFGFAICELITWETVLALFSQAFENGGPAGCVYGFIIAWSSSLSVYTVISELASMAPIAAGQYYWVYILAAPKWKVFCSYIIGWLTSLAWVATVATECLFAGTMLQGWLIVDYSPGYDAQLWQGTLLAWMVVVVCVFVNAVIPGLLPKFEIFIIVFHLAGFAAIVAVLWHFAEPYSTNQFVWATAFNEGGWSSQGLSFCVGFLGNVATFVGADASVHLAEEVSNAAVNIPRAIISSMTINGLVGFTTIVTVLYCIGDVESVLNTDTGFSFIQVFYNTVNSKAGATAMGAIVLALTWACAIGITTTASRVTWSFARDNGIPFSRLLSRVSKHNQVPVIAIFVVAGLAMLLHLIYIGSSAAFNDVVSLTITGFYSSYLLPSAMLLYRRIKGQISPYIEDPRPTAGYDPEGGHQQHFDAIEDGALRDKIAGGGKDSTLVQDPRRGPGTVHLEHPGIEGHHSKETSEVSPPASMGPQDVHSPVAEPLAFDSSIHLRWGPFHVPGWFGILNNLYACLYMVFVIFWSVWPPSTPVTASTMNYSVVVTGGVVIFSVVWYYIRGHKEYKGPIIDDDVAAQAGQSLH